jgi:ubiquinone biosynthesis protein
MLHSSSHYNERDGRELYNPPMHPLRQKLRLFARALTILFLFVRTGVWYALGWCGMRLAGRDRASRQAFFGTCVFELFRDLGATFIKVGQIMSTRPDLLPPHVIEALQRLQDDVGPFPFSLVKKTIEADFARPLDELFVEFALRPIASASVAQVHKARLPGGELVAVKVRRPDIEELCGFDLVVMRLYASILELIPSLRLLAPVESVNQFGRAIAMQLDFRVEADNNRRFRRNFAAEPDVIVPRLYEALCSKRVLVMEFIEGEKILHFGRSGLEPRRLGQLGFRVMLKMVFADGFVHADLHPGNILVTPDGRVALLDLGLVAELDNQHRTAFARYFAAWAQGDGTTMADIMVRHSPSSNIADPEGFRSAVQAFVNRYHGKRLGEVEVARVVYEMMAILRRYRVRVNATFTMVNIAIAVTEGIGKQLDPTLDLMNEAMPFFMAMEFGAST